MGFQSLAECDLICVFSTLHRQRNSSTKAVSSTVHLLLPGLRLTSLETESAR